MVITFNFSKINNPPNKALLVLLKTQSLFLIDMCLSKGAPDQISKGGELLIYV